MKRRAVDGQRDENVTEEEIERIRETWAKAVSAPDIVGRMFYDRLFRRAPAARKMFADDMTQQQASLHLVSCCSRCHHHVDAAFCLLRHAN